MTENEAFIFLKLEKEADTEAIEDQFELLFFELKKYLIEKLPVEKLFAPKLKQAQKLFLARNLLTNNIEIPTLVPEFNIEFPDEIELAFQQYHQYRNRLKQQILNCLTYEELEQVAKQLLFLEKKYAEKWMIEKEDENEVFISTQPDAMALLKAIHLYTLTGNKSFQDLKQLKNNPPEILIKEMKRLSLLYKKY